MTDVVVDIGEEFEPHVGVTSLNRRLTKLEKHNTIECAVEEKKSEMRKAELDQIHNEIVDKLRKDIGPDKVPSKLLIACDRAIYYVEEYAPRLATILGYSLLGDLKLALVVSFVSDLFCDFSGDFIATTTQYIFDCNYSNKKNKDGTRSIEYNRSVVDDQAFDNTCKKKQRRNFFRCGCLKGEPQA